MCWNNSQKTTKFTKQRHKIVTYLVCCAAGAGDGDKFDRIQSPVYVH